MFILKSITKYLKFNDYFGHKVEMHFGSYLNKEDKADSVYKTPIGGFISIVLKAFLCYYVYFFFSYLITNANNTSYYLYQYVNWTEIGK